MISIEFNDNAVASALQRLAANLADMTPAMSDIADDWLLSTKKRVQAGLDPDGNPFAPRSQVTLDRYAKAGRVFGNPLRYSGAMISQIAKSSGSDYAQVGSNALQAAVMQFGQPQGASRKSPPIPWGNIPARPFLGISDGDRADILATVVRYLGQATE